MKNKIFIIAIFLFTGALTTYSQNINGKWAGKVMDQFDVVYTFKADGEVLTGTTKDPEGTDIQRCV